MKRILTLFVLAALAGSLFAADNVTGLWKIIDDKTQKPNAIAVLYTYQGKLYGRLLVTISTKTGEISDTIATRTNSAKYLVGQPAICGLDFVYLMQDKGKEWVGLIVDPEPGDEYDCVIHKEGDTLIVRGQLKGFGFIGRDQKWVSASPSDLPIGVETPSADSLVPVVPKHK
jgi:uncharacterized protein (DUF2147 family)